MEIVGEDGWSICICIRTNSKLEFGRGLGFHVGDQTLSRRHILFELPKDSETRVYFQVLGKNPVWVFNNGETRVFRKSDKGEMRVGDSFCVSSSKPILFKLNKKSEGQEENRVLEEVESGEQEMAESIQSGISEVEGDLGFQSVDVSDVDPVKEFGFLVIGHEFDDYPKAKIRVVKEWDWFLEEQRVDSDIDEATERKRSKGKKGTRRKDEGYDEEWTGESEDEVISKVRNAKKPRYTTRSKDSNKPVGSVGGSKKSEQKKTVGVNEDEEEEDDDEEEDEDTLGGFIVDEEDDDDDDDDDDDEEEFEEDNDDEED